MRAVGGEDPAHAHRWCTFQQAFGDDSICFGDALETTRNGEHSIVNALDNFADTSFHTCLVAKVGYILACFADDDPSFLGSHDSPKRYLRLCILFFRSGYGLPIWPNSVFVPVEAHPAQRVSNT